MKTNMFVLFLAFCIYGCIQVSPKAVTIPNGNYISNGERVMIDGKFVSFYIRPKSGRFKDKNYVGSFKYPYSIRSDGKLEIFGSSNDSLYFFEISRYTWTWSGSSLSRSDGVDFSMRESQ